MYLIVKCRELNDQYECDCDREPYRITFDPEDYGDGYEIYEIDQEGFLNLIKDYSEPSIAEQMSDRDWLGELMNDDDDDWLVYEDDGEIGVPYHEPAPAPKPEPIPDGCARVTCGTAYQRKDIDAPLDSTLGEIIKSCGYSFPGCSYTFNGVPIRFAEDFNYTLANLGVKEGSRCVLIQVKVSTNV